MRPVLVALESAATTRHERAAACVGPLGHVPIYPTIVSRPCVYRTLAAAVWKPLLALRRRKLESIKRFIFVASTGRCGTLTLAHILNGISDSVVAWHEPSPTLGHVEMTAANNGNGDMLRALFRYKLLRIAADARGRRCYCETNHTFIKSFFEHCVGAFGDRLAIICLHRDLQATADSIYRLNHIPGTPFGNRWYLDHRACGNLIQMGALLESGGALDHDWYRCLWYCYELQARTERYRRRYPHLRWVDFATADLGSAPALTALFAALGLPHERFVPDAFAGVHLNRKTANKPSTQARFSAQEQDRMHARFLDHLSSFIPLNALRPSGTPR